MSLCKGPETLWWALLHLPTQMPASRAVFLCFWLFFVGSFWSYSPKATSTQGLLQDKREFETNLGYIGRQGPCLGQQEDLLCTVQAGKAPCIGIFGCS